MLSKLSKVVGLTCLAICGSLFALDNLGVVNVSQATSHVGQALRGAAPQRRLQGLISREQARGEIEGAAVESSYFWFIPAQVVFAVFYYCTVVSNYPYLYNWNMASAELQAMPAPMALIRTSPANCCLSWFCPQARAAMTFDKTGTLDYWLSLVAMFVCPFCTVCYTNACTPLNLKLGGPPANPISSCLCTWLCFCCVIAQDAESLDMATGARAEVCGVSGGAYPMPYGGGMVMGPFGGGVPMSPMAGPMGTVGPMNSYGMYPQQQMGMYPPQF